MTQSPNTIQLEASTEAAHFGLRLDQVLADLFPEYSRSKLKTWIQDGNVAVNGEVITVPRHKMQMDELVTVQAEMDVQVTSEAQDIALNIVYEDEHILVINKPADLVVHPGAGNLILFNNYHSGNNAAVLEIETPIQDDGSYELIGNNPYGPDSWSWIYNTNISSNMQSGAFRMPNGNTFITEAEDARIIEVTSSGQIVYDYSWPGNTSIIARAMKYAPEFFDSQYVLGDVNGDESIDILDVVISVNIVLGAADSNPAADINSDGIINILDIISLINIILE